MLPAYREATLTDIPDLMSIRNAVRENALVSARIEQEDYVQAMSVDGRAWLCSVDGVTVGFVNPRLVQRDIWALFLRESHEGRGIGGALMDIAERWLFEQGLEEIRLTTSPDTRADRLYRFRGWQAYETTASGELGFRLERETWRRRSSP